MAYVGPDKRLYNSWNNMRQRCENPKHTSYKYYGGKGVKVCDEWLDHQIFMDWAKSNGYAAGLQLDRIDSNGNYEPSNCRWVSASSNMGNRKNSIVLVVNGQRKCVAEWAREIDIDPKIIYHWVYYYSKEYAERQIKSYFSGEKYVPTIPGRIRELRGDVSQIEFAKKIGIPRGTLTAYETGAVNPSKGRLKHMADKCGVPIEFFDCPASAPTEYRTPLEMYSSSELLDELARRLNSH